jgi:hypothetical protein
VIGQVIAAAILLAHAYPKHRLIRQTIVVVGTPEPALQCVCNKIGITVVHYARADLWPRCALGIRGYAAAIPMIGAVGGLFARLPTKALLEKSKTPPSLATMR